MQALQKAVQDNVLLLILLSGAAGLMSCTNAEPHLSGINLDLRSSDADLSSLTLSSGVLVPAFERAATDYTSMFVGANSVTVTPTAADSGASITVNGVPVVSGQPSSPIPLPFGTTTITVEVHSANQSAELSRVKTYTVLAHQLAREGFIKASNTDAGDRFGYSVALSGDTLAVGAPAESSAVVGTGDGNQLDNNLLHSGAVYIFMRVNGGWIQQAYIKASNPSALSEFGASVALSGDTLVVGAIGESSASVGVNGNQTDHSANSAGAAYVFTRANNEWTQQAYLKASNTNAGDFFGWSVTISGDMLAVGARGEDGCGTGSSGLMQDNNGCPDAGAVYVFTRANGLWNQQAYLKASNTNALDLFGEALSLSGETLAVGASSEDSCGIGTSGADETNNGCSGAGAAYVFTRAGGGWSQQAYLKTFNADSGDEFGFSVALNVDTVAVAAPGEASCGIGVNPDPTNNGCREAGAVYVFTRTAGVWSQHSYLKASNANAGDLFGHSLSLDGQVLAVGSRWEDSLAFGVNPGSGAETDNSAPNSGAVYVFTQSGRLWRQDALVKASNTAPNYEFGGSVAVSGNTLAVGSVGESSSLTGVITGNTDDIGAPYSGAVYVWR